jgi:hypothetical protein
MTNRYPDDELKNWKTKVMIAGAIIGALAGAGAAFIYTQRAQDPYHKPEFTSGDGVKLGLLLLGLLRQVSSLGDDK